MSMRTKPGAHILLVEDNPGDVDLILEVLKQSSPPVKVTIAVDGVDALERLRAPGELPNLVLLDLNLPKKDGRSVLREMKEDARLAHIPVVVLSSSEADRDLRDAYGLHANCFVTKPAELDDFLAAVRGIEQFWLRLAKLPSSRELVST